MAWLWQRDIDDEKRMPGPLFILKNMFATKGLTLIRAEKELSDLGIGLGHKVLDFGCGLGQYSIAAARLVGDGGSVQALDLHPTALETIEKKAAKHGLSNIDTIYSELETGLDDKSIDTVLLFGILNTRKDVSSILRELHRVVVEDGKVLVRSSGLKNGRLEELMVKDGYFHLEGKHGKTFSFIRVGGKFQEI
jgi:ubiquinone/menaquinone biosynthesis C-methylase UbiE